MVALSDDIFSVIQEEEPELFERRVASKLVVFKSFRARRTTQQCAPKPLAPAFAVCSPALGLTRLLDGPLD